jgi:hypothetical protein
VPRRNGEQFEQWRFERHGEFRRWKLRQQQSGPCAEDDRRGRWNGRRRSRSVSTSHFSTWAAVVGWRLEPPEAAAKVGTSTALTVMTCWPRSFPAANDIATLQNECQPGTTTRSSPAHVNGVPGGNAEFGTVADNVTALNFIAPAHLPALEPITVLVGVGIEWDGAAYALASGIVVYNDDAYAFDITIDMSQSAVVSSGNSSHSKSWNERIAYTGIIRNTAS